MLSAKTYKVVLEFNTTDAYFAWAGSDGYGIYGDTYDVNCTYGEEIYVDWMSEVEAWHANGKTLAGWSYNGQLIIDATGKVVNKELLASIPTDSQGRIHLVAVWEN